MRHRRGPTKRLAPTLGPDTSCPHEFTEDEGVQLEIDCTECSGAHDLANSKCLTSAMNAACGGAVPEVVILKRYTHKRYRGDSVWLVSRAAAELAALNRVLASSEQLSDKECRTCAASRQLVIVDLRRRLLENPRAYMSGGLGLPEEIRRGRETVACTRAKECVEAGLGASTIYGGGD